MIEYAKKTPRFAFIPFCRSSTNDIGFAKFINNQNPSAHLEYICTLGLQDKLGTQ